MSSLAPALIAGGYGLVGSQIARLLRRRHPQLPLQLGGRHPERGEALARELDRAEAVPLDLMADRPLSSVTTRPSAIVAVANDPEDRLLWDAIRLGIPYVDITRWTQRVRETVWQIAPERLSAPILFSSAWMGGVIPVVAAYAMRELAVTEEIDISILYATRDQAGPNSVDYMDRLQIPFEVQLAGQRQLVEPLTDGRQVLFPGGRRAHVYRLDTPEQATLPRFSGAKTVTTRLGFDDAASTSLLRLLVRSGIWKAISGPRFAGLRRSMLYNPGPGAPHEVVIALSGRDAAGSPRSVSASLSDPLGQSHLTAVGALLQLERVLGLGSYPVPEPRVLFPESTPRLDDCIETLREMGVVVRLESGARSTSGGR